jgi:hypothetical protein
MAELSKNRTKNESRLLNQLRSARKLGQSKQWRNFKYYYNTFNRVPFDLKSNVPLGYNSGWQDGDEDYYPTSTINVIKSAVDTLVSKVQNNKVRPLFTPVNARDWKVGKTIKEVQVFIDQLFYKTNANDVISKAFKIACIYDSGFIFIDPFRKNLSLEVLSPWQVGLFQSDWEYSNIERDLTTILVARDQYEARFLKRDFGITEEFNTDLVTLETYIDCIAGEAKLFVNGKEKKAQVYRGERAPILSLHFNNPLFGAMTTSLVDDLIPLQRRINFIDSKIKEAMELTQSNVMFIPEGSSIDISVLDNGAGNVLKYRPMPGSTGQPVDYVAPSPIDNAYISERDKLIELAFQMAGISELSAQGEKPSGLDSGKALQTMEDIESNRFETIFSQVIRGYVDLARMLFDIIPEDGDILPESGSYLKWKDVVEARDLFEIQYTASSALSNDPEKRLEMLNQMAEMEIIDKSKIAEYLEMPDADRAFNEANAINDAVERLIYDCLKMKEKELLEFNIPIFIDYQTLEKRCIALQNLYYGNWEDSKDVIGRLQVIYMKVQKLMSPTTVTNETGAPEGEASKDNALGGFTAGSSGLQQSAGIESGPANVDMTAALPTQEVPADLTAQGNKGAATMEGGSPGMANPQMEGALQ